MRNSTKIFLLVITSFFIASSILISQIKKRPARILTSSNLGEIEKLDVLNTKYYETNISITPDGKYLYFETDRPSEWSTKDYGRIGKYDADIWYSKLIDGKWQEPQNVGRNINTPQSEGEPNISPDGQTMYFQSWRSDWAETGGPYYKAELKGDTWSNIIGLNSELTKFFQDMGKKRTTGANIGTDGATFSADGKKFIFSFGLDYYGNMDIYITYRDSKGNWSYPEMLPLSTEYNDRCPFLAADGKTLYFASNGYDGFGKMDIYKTTLNDDGSNGEVYNIGEPFNTKDDDYGFLITASGNDVYFVRSGDIYRMDLKDAITEIKPTHTIILSGIIRDSLTGEPLEANISIIDIATQKETGFSRSNAKSGEYSIVLQGGKKYRQLARKENYSEFSRNFETSSDLSVYEMNYDVNLVTGKAKEAIVEITEPEAVEQCISKLFDRRYSIGINPAYPLAIGIKTEVNYQNFGGSVIGMYLPSVGEYDDPKPPDDMMSNNYSTLILVSLNYNFPLLNCNFYPYTGLFTGVRTRYWKKPIQEGNPSSMKSGSYSDTPWGFTIGGKVFLSEKLYIEASLGFGKFAFHDFPSGDIKKYEFKSIPWVAICYMFE
jgi:hypothetical protein